MVSEQNNISSASTNTNFISNHAKERIDALKALAQLLLHEIESVEKTLPEKQASSEENISLSDEMERYESDLIRHALIRAQGHQRRAAKMLGTKTSTLNAKIKRYGIDSLNLGRVSEMNN